MFLGFENETSNKEEILGIVINASSEVSLFPKESISIVDLNNITLPPRAQLGLLDSSLFTNSQNSLLTSDLANKYGLYCDNVYVKGTMVSEKKIEN